MSLDTIPDNQYNLITTVPYLHLRVIVPALQRQLPLVDKDGHLWGFYHSYTDNF